MTSKVDFRHREIGGHHRALSRYYMIANRLKTTHRRRNSKYAGIELRVSKEDFIKWFMARDYDGCSVDRIDVNGHYELSNMQVIPLALNMSKDRVKARDGCCECYSCKKIKPIENFAVDKRRRTGHSTICKSCDNSRKKNHSDDFIQRKRIKSLEYYYANRKLKKDMQCKSK